MAFFIGPGSAGDRSNEDPGNAGTQPLPFEGPAVDEVFLDTFIVRIRATLEGKKAAGVLCSAGPTGKSGLTNADSVADLTGPFNYPDHPKVLASEPGYQSCAGTALFLNAVGRTKYYTANLDLQKARDRTFGGPQPGDGTTGGYET